MSNKNNLIQFLFITALLFQLSFQQSNNFLSNIIQNVDEAIVGSGNQGVVITNEGGNTLDDSLFHFQSVELEGLSSDEWTVQWVDNEGEAFDLIDENGLIIAVGPDNSTEDVTNQLANAAGIPAASVSGLIGTLAHDLVEEIYKSGGNETLTGNQVYSKAILPVSLAVLGAKTASSSLDEAGDAISQAATNGASDVKDAAESAGNSIKDAAESVGDKAGDVASDAWQHTKDAADAVGDKASDIGSDIASKANEFGENVSDAAKDAWEDTKNAASSVGDKAQDVGNTIADKASDAANTVADKAKDLGENVSNGAQTAWNETKNVADKVGDAVGNAFDSVKDGIGSLFGH